MPLSNAFQPSFLRWDLSHWSWLAGKLLGSVSSLTPSLRLVLRLQVCLAVSVYQVGVGDPDSSFPACVILCPFSRLLSPFCFIFISMIYVEFFKKYVSGFMCFTCPLLISFIRKTNFVSFCCCGSFVEGLLTIHVDCILGLCSPWFVLLPVTVLNLAALQPVFGISLLIPIK